MLYLLTVPGLYNMIFPNLPLGISSFISILHASNFTLQAFGKRFCPKRHSLRAFKPFQEQELDITRHWQCSPFKQTRWV